jgi:hypothetical protein
MDGPIERKLLIATQRSAWRPNCEPYSGERMGLDASVYCDCFERRRLRTQPRPEWGVDVDEEGGRSATSRDLDQQIAFDAWNHSACEHEDGVLLHHRIGNIALIGLFRQLLNPHVDRLPVIVRKIIYSGSHAGDSLSLETVAQLGAEVEALAQVHDKDRKNEQFLRDFEQQLRELVEYSGKVGKPIVF